MSTLLTVDDLGTPTKTDKPGAILAAQREQKGYTVAYVANKLHLRVRMVELLENDNYAQLPEAVFIKGYLRAYAKLVDLAVEPLLEIFNHNYAGDRKVEKALWQSRRAPARAEYAVRWLTGTFALIVVIAVIFWWQNNKENEKLFSPHMARVETTKPAVADNEIRLTDLSKMRSLLSADQNVLTEKQSA
jgi:cytoskeleton protein RodZ